MLETLLLLYARRFPIRRGKLRVVDCLWQAAVGRGNTQRLARLEHSGLRMPCDLREMLQRQFYFFGTYFVEEHILACWQREARGARTVFDVGANAGIYSLAALAAAPGAVVHAFEPTPEIAGRLRATATLNGMHEHIRVHEVAVSSTSGLARLNRFRGESGTNDGMNYITAPDPGEPADRVSTVRLDDFCAERAIERIDLLKLDIQGHEHHALLGAADLLKNGRIGTVFVELNWNAAGGEACAASASIELLEHAGFRFSEPREPLVWRSAGEWMRGLSDIVARAG